MQVLLSLVEQSRKVHLHQKEEKDKVHQEEVKEMMVKEVIEIFILGIKTINLKDFDVF